MRNSHQQLKKCNKNRHALARHRKRFNRFFIAIISLSYYVFLLPIYVLPPTQLTCPPSRITPIHDNNWSNIHESGPKKKSTEPHYYNTVVLVTKTLLYFKINTSSSWRAIMTSKPGSENIHPEIHTHIHISLTPPKQQPIYDISSLSNTHTSTKSTTTMW